MDIWYKTRFYSKEQKQTKMNYLHVIASRENDSFYNTAGSKEEKIKKIDDAMFHLAMILNNTSDLPNESDSKSEYCEYRLDLPITKIEDIPVICKVVFNVEERQALVHIYRNDINMHHSKLILHEPIDYTPKWFIFHSMCYSSGDKNIVRNHHKPVLVEMVEKLDLQKLFVYIFSLYWEEDELKYRKEQKVDDCCICLEQTDHYGECGHHVCKDCHFQTWLNLPKPNKKFEIPCPICRCDFHYDEEGRNITK